MARTLQFGSPLEKAVELAISIVGENQVRFGIKYAVGFMITTKLRKRGMLLSDPEYQVEYAKEWDMIDPDKIIRGKYV